MKNFLIILAIMVCSLVGVAHGNPESGPEPAGFVPASLPSFDLGVPPDAAAPVSVAPSAAPSVAPSAPVVEPASAPPSRLVVVSEGEPLAVDNIDLGSAITQGRAAGWPLPAILLLLAAVAMTLIAMARTAGLLVSKNAPIIASLLIGAIYGTITAYMTGGWEAALTFALAGPGSVVITKVIRLVRPSFSTAPSLFVDP